MGSKRTFWQKVKHLQLGVLVAVVFTVGYALGSEQSVTYAQSDVDLPAEVEAEFDPLFQAYNLIQDRYVEDVDTTVLIDGAIRGMVEALEDPYSNYVEAEFYEFVRSDLDGSIEGIGVVITESEEDPNAIQILNVLDDTPAAESGLQVGDIFYAVEGEEVYGLTFLELAARVRGSAGTTVALTMRRDDQLIDFDVERAEIIIPNVETDILPGDIAYISMAEFSSVARGQVDEALAELDVNSRAGLIFDLRGNPGGFLTAAVDIAGLFIEDGTLLIEEFGDGRVETFLVEDDNVFRVDQDGNEVLYSAGAAYADVQVPVVVLVDERSASASELVAGAWQANNSVMLIGATTFGKGTVQIQNELINGGGVRLTIARWLTPDGVWISEQGVTPDLVVEMPPEAGDDTDPQLEAAIKFLTTEPVIE